MAKMKKLSTAEEVANYISTLQHPLKEVVLALRKAILETDNQIGEQIKWNAPAFYYTGEMQPFDPKEYKRDIVVFHLRSKDFILLIFPTGTTINDTTGLLGGVFPDTRKTVQFATLEEVESRREDLQTVIKEWLQMVHP